MNMRKLLLHLNQEDNLAKLYGMLKKPLFWFLFSIVKNYETADDLSEEVFLKLLKYYKTYNPLKNPKTWIYTIAKNTAYTYLKQNKDILTEETFQIDLHQYNLVQTDDAIMVEEYLSYLDDLERYIVIMHLFGGLNHLEISKILNMTHSQVRSKYSYALKKLRKKVDL